MTNCTECGKTIRVVNSPEGDNYCTCLDDTDFVLIAENMDMIEIECRAFAREYRHLPGVARMLLMAETGMITWADMNKIAKQALANAVQAVSD